MKELAVLIPVYNAGELLLDSVESCARAGVPAERYALIVVDNCSTDGSIELLPSHDSRGVPIRVFRNEHNLGRIGNWNRALEIAEHEGFEFAAFLFAGDVWAPQSSVTDLLNLMRRSGAVLGMAPLLILQQDGVRREGARISIPQEAAVIEGGSLLEYAVRVGRLPFAPIQANVYRLFSADPLRFDTDTQRALNTDIEATVAWLRQHPGPVALVAKPFLVWKEHSGRFFVTQDPWFVMLETRASLARVSAAAGIAVDWASANAISLLTAARELSGRKTARQRIAFLYRVFRYLRTAQGGLRVSRFLSFTLNKALRNFSYLRLPAAGNLQSTGNKAQHSATAITRYGL